MQTFLYILLAIFILLVMITIHEFGHYIAAKIFKFKVTEFSIGFGPKLLQKIKKDGEKFSIRAIPLGGYCAFEDTDENGKETEKSFYKEKPYKRIVVLFSGALFNLISAVLFSFIYLISVGYAAPSVSSVTLNPETGIAYNQFAVGDEILAVDGIEINASVTLTDAIKKADKKNGTNGEVVFTVLRDGENIKVPVVRQLITPSYAGFGIEYENSVFDGNGNQKVPVTVRAITNDPNGKAYNPLFSVGDEITAVNGQSITVEKSIYVLTKDIPIGETVEFSVSREQTNITVSVKKQTIIGAAYDGFGFSHDTEIKRLGLGKSLLQTFPFTGKMAWSVLGSLGGLVTGAVPVTDMAGPVGTITQMAQLSAMDWRNILVLLPLLAANLAIFNLLPLPALDGSKIIFTAIEWIRKKPVKREVENMIHFIGLMVLLGLVIVIDIIGFIFRGGAGTGWLRL